MRQVAEDKILIRVFTIDSYKTVLISPTLTANEVEKYLRKKMMGTSSEGIDFEDYRLFTSVDDGEAQPVASDEIVWDIQKGTTTVHFIFKIPDQRISVKEYLAASEVASAPQVATLRQQKTKSARIRSFSKVRPDRAMGLSFDDGIFRLGNRAGNDQRAVSLRYKDKTIPHFTIQAGPTWEASMEQILLLFGLKEDVSHFALQEKHTGVYLSSYAEVLAISSSHDNALFLLVSSPLIEVKKAIDAISSAQTGGSIRDSLKVLGSLAQNQAWVVVIPLFLCHGGLAHLINLVHNFASHPPDTVLLTLRLIELCISAYELEKAPVDCGFSLPSLKIDGSTAKLFAQIPISRIEKSRSVRIAACEVSRALVQFSSSFYPPFDCFLREYAQNPSDFDCSNDCIEDSQEREAERPGGEHMIVPLLWAFLEEPKDVILKVSILNLMSMVLAHSPYKVDPEKPGESQEERLSILLDSDSFIDQIHSWAVSPGREEVEKAILLFQERLIAASFWEKDEVFQRDNPFHEAKLASLWTQTYPEIPLTDRISRQWKKMGFQSDDPTRDFRAMGMLGLKHLNSFAVHEKETFRKMCDEMHSRNSEQFYPIATAGMIITEMLENYLKTCTFESGLVLPCLFDGPDAIVSIYFTLSRSLFRLFNDRHADYMDFNLIRDELKELFEQSCEKCPNVRQLSQHLSFEDDEKSTIRTTAVFQWGPWASVQSSPSIEHLGSLMSKPVLSVSASSHVIVVTETEGVWGWGACSCGQLGMETAEKKLTSPHYLDSFSSKQITKVYVSDGRTAATTASGELWMCGELIPARDGEPAQSSSLRHIQLSANESTLFGVTKVAFGQSHGVILVRSEKVGKVYTWGRNSFLQLGLSETKDQMVAWPSYVSALSNVSIVNVAAGRNFCVATGSDRAVYAWGQNVLKRAGIPILGTNEKEKEAFDRPKLVRGFKPFTALTDIVCGDTHTLALTKKGQVLSWGDGKGGKLGNGGEESQLKPKEVPIEPCVAICAGYNYSMAIGRSGKLYSWGEGGRGALGHGDLNDVHSPKEVVVSGKSVKCEKVSGSTSGVTVGVLMYDLPSVSASVFGIPLARLAAKKGDSLDSAIPFVVSALCDHILVEGRGVQDLFMKEERYRSLKDSTPLRLLRHCFETSQDVDMSVVHPRTSVALLIHWIEELPSPIVTPDVYKGLFRVAEEEDPAQRCAKFGEIIYRQMNSLSSLVFRFLLSFFGKLVAGLEYEVSCSSLEFILSVVCGVSPTGVLSGELEDESQRNPKLFSFLLADISIIQFPFYVTLLGVCSFGLVSPLSGGELRDLWCSFVVLGMPQQLQSQLLWHLKHCCPSSPLPPHSPSNLNSSRKLPSAHSDPDLATIQPSSRAAQEELSKEAPTPESAAEMIKETQKEIESLGSESEKGALGNWEARVTLHRRLVLLRIQEMFQSSQKGSCDDLANVVREVIGFLREREANQSKLEHLHSLRASMGSIMGELEDFTSFFSVHQQEAAFSASSNESFPLDGASSTTNVPRLKVKQVPRSVPPLYSAKSSPNFLALASSFSSSSPSPSPSPCPARSPTPPRTPPFPRSPLSASCSSPSSSSPVFVSLNNEEWTWANLQSPHLLSGNFQKSMASLLASEEEVEGEMKNLILSFSILKKKWEGMASGEMEIQRNISHALSRLIPFFEGVERKLKERAEQTLLHSQSLDLDGALLDAAEGYAALLQNTLQKAGHHRGSDVLKEKLVQCALDMHDHLAHCCVSPEFDEVRKSSRWGGVTQNLGGLFSHTSASNKGLAPRSRSKKEGKKSTRKKSASNQIELAACSAPLPSSQRAQAVTEMKGESGALPVSPRTEEARRRVLLGESRGRAGGEEEK